MIKLQDKVDRRIKRTRQHLKDALICLSEEKNFSNISVTDILRLANTHRSTFYAHYKNKEELISCIIDELAVGMMQNVDDSKIMSMSLAEETSEEVISQELFLYAAEYKDYFQFILTNPQLMQQLSTSFYKTYLNEFESKYSNDSHLNINKGFYICCLTSVTIGIIYHWLINTNKKYSAEYAAKEASKLFNVSLFQF